MEIDINKKTNTSYETIIEMCNLYELLSLVTLDQIQGQYEIHVNIKPL